MFFSIFIVIVGWRKLFVKSLEILSVRSRNEKREVSENEYSVFRVWEFLDFRNCVVLGIF